MYIGSCYSQQDRNVYDKRNRKIYIGKRKDEAVGIIIIIIIIIITIIIIIVIIIIIIIIEVRFIHILKIIMTTTRQQKVLEKNVFKKVLKHEDYKNTLSEAMNWIK